MPVYRSFLTFALLFGLTLSIFLLEGCAASAEEAVLAVDRAEDIVLSCYQVVLEAESAGGNVSSLLARLNEAGELLAQAHILYRLEDFDGAVYFADLCGQVGEEIWVEARGFRGLVAEEAVQRFRWTMIGSVLSVTIIVGGSFLGWRIFRLRYYRRILEMKPEVSSDES